jgi:hypothetical protein
VTVARKSYRLVCEPGGASRRLLTQKCPQDGAPHITTIARAQLMGQTDREVLKTTGLGMRGVAETGRPGPGRSRTDIRRSPTHCVVAFKSGSMVSHPLSVAIKWRAYGVSWLAGRMRRKRHRHWHARAGLPILCVGSAAHGHDHTDARIGAGHLGGVFNAQSKELRRSVYCAG